MDKETERQLLEAVKQIAVELEGIRDTLVIALGPLSDDEWAKLPEKILDKRTSKD